MRLRSPSAFWSTAAVRLSQLFLSTFTYSPHLLPLSLSLYNHLSPQQPPSRQSLHHQISSTFNFTFPYTISRQVFSVTSSDSTSRIARLGDMAPPRTRLPDSDGPSTTDASANEEVEVQEQDKPINGFGKFSVSAPFFAAVPRCAASLSPRESFSKSHHMNSQGHIC